MAVAINVNAVIPLYLFVGGMKKNSIKIQLKSLAVPTTSSK
jgi:hypothetical protein